MQLYYLMSTKKTRALSALYTVGRSPVTEDKSTKRATLSREAAPLTSKGIRDSRSGVPSFYLSPDESSYFHY